MRLPEIALLTCLASSLAPEALNAEPMGATSRTSIQIVASVAPRFQVTDAYSLAMPKRGQSQFCIQSNAPAEAYSLISVDGEKRSVATVSSSTLCKGGLELGGTWSRFAGDSNSPTSSGSVPQLVLVAPE